MRLLIAVTLLAFTSALLPAQDQEGAPDAQKLFEQLDKNSDGKLLAGEIPEEQSRFFDRLLRIADKNKDGELNREEFTTAHNEERGPELPLNGLGGQGRRRGNPQQMFERLDRNRDGKVTKDELPEGARERLAPLFARLGKEELTQDDLRNVGELLGRDGPDRPGMDQMDQLFQRLDANGDGKLSAEESASGAGVRMFLNSVREQLGKDPDAEITKEEFESHLRKQRERFGDRRRPEGFGGPPRHFVLIQKLDANGDGRLNKNELAKAAEKFDELDTNSDGELDPQELLGAPMGRGFADRDGNPPRPRGNFGAAPGGRMFQQLDKDGDGKLAEDELPPRLQNRFERLDRNGDGHLTQDELQAAFRGRPGNRPDEPSDDADANPRPRRPPAE